MYRTPISHASVVAAEEVRCGDVVGVGDGTWLTVAAVTHRTTTIDRTTTVELSLVDGADVNFITYAPREAVAVRRHSKGDQP
jgi:hypothetical protein